jgi:hypothetical protein
MAAPNGIAFRDLEVNHFYKLSQNPQIVGTAPGVSAEVTNNLWELKDTPHQLLHLNCSNDVCSARFRRPQANGARFMIHSTYLQNGTLTRFKEERPAPGAAGASGGAKRKTRRSKKTRKLKKSKYSRKH